MYWEGVGGADTWHISNRMFTYELQFSMNILSTLLSLLSYHTYIHRSTMYHVENRLETSDYLRSIIHWVFVFNAYFIMVEWTHWFLSPEEKKAFLMQLQLAIKLYCIHVKCSPKSCPAWVTKWQLWHVTGEQHDIQSETCITSRWVAAACLVHSIYQPAPVYDRQAMLMSTYLKNWCHTQSATDNKHRILAQFSLPNWIQWEFLGVLY